MDICFEGIGQVVATFRTKDEKLEDGMAVTLNDNGEVGLGEEDGKPLCGVTVSAARGGAVAVQIGGVVKVGCSGKSMKEGWQELACDKNGGVKLAADSTNGAKFLVLAADEKSVVVKL